MARDQGPDVVLNPQQMNILIPTVSSESVEALVFDLGGVLLDVQLQRTLRAFEALIELNPRMRKGSESLFKNRNQRRFIYRCI